MKNKVYIGFSGGVDSAVSALLLKKKYDVKAVMFRNIPKQKSTTENEKLAKRVANHIDIPFEVVDFTKQFNNLVINPFLNSYSKGKTPNPCVKCNIQFKFGVFATWCFKNGADLIATGHYCNTKNGHLYKRSDSNKDQSYFLNGVSHNILEKTVFPVGNITKERVRRIAKRNHLPNESQRDSQEVCFIKTNLKDYLDEHISSPQGDIVDIDSYEVVGIHDGIYSLTLGQRKGVNVGGVDKPYYVAKKDVDSNTIYVAKGKLNPTLWRDSFQLSNFNVIHPANKNISENLTGKVRYKSKEIPCTFDWENNKVIFKEKVWTPSLGQSIVIYKGNECIGGGEIEEIQQ
jgi:tRNA-specific 2-thiouridylase